VFIHVNERGVSLEEPTDFNSFHVVVEGVANLPVEWRTAEGNHVFIPRGILQSLAGHLAQDARWQIGFEKMIEFAVQSGWVDGSGAIRAHVE
jgi:hypothetical protein